MTSAEERPGIITSFTTSVSSRPPGLFTHRHLWVIYLLGCAGLGIDALLAAVVVGEMFNLPDLGTYAIVFAVGVLAAVAATEAAISANHRHHGAAALLMALVIGIGVAMAVLRFAAGVSGGAAIDPGQFAGQPVPTVRDGEGAATGLMLVLHCAASIGLFLSASKIFVADRGDLRRHDKTKRMLVEKLGPTGGAVHRDPRTSCVLEESPRANDTASHPRTGSS